MFDAVLAICSLYGPSSICASVSNRAAVAAGVPIRASASAAHRAASSVPPATMSLNGPTTSSPSATSSSMASLIREWSWSRTACRSDVSMAWTAWSSCGRSPPPTESPEPVHSARRRRASIIRRRSAARVVSVTPVSGNGTSASGGSVEPSSGNLACDVFWSFCSVVAVVCDADGSACRCDGVRSFSMDWWTAWRRTMAATTRAGAEAAATPTEEAPGGRLFVGFSCRRISSRII